MFSTGSGIISDLQDRGEYTNLNSYVDRMDFDYDEKYEGEGLFGKPKYKNKWYFSRFYSSANEFIEDLKSSFDSMSHEISERVAELVNSALRDFENLVKEELNKKEYFKWKIVILLDYQRN